MTMKLRSLLWGAVAAAFLSGAVMARIDGEAGGRTEERSMHVVLIGASIGKAWNLSDLPRRTGNDRFSFEALQVWEYDKSEAVEETLMRPSRKFRLTATYFKGFLQPAPQPADIVILKECSSYFPGDRDPELPRKRELFKRWVEEVRAKGIKVVIATVAPITRARAERDGAAKQQAIRQFNDWVREYAAAQRLPLLDLEQALRADDAQRYLRDDYTSGDGSHLNRAAYDVLDRLMLDTLCQTRGDCRAVQARAR